MSDKPTTSDAHEPATVTDDAEPSTAPDASDGVTSDDDGLSPMERLQAEKDHLLDVLARTQAEFANYRKRIARDQAQLQDRAKATVAEAFIPTLDALDSAAGHNESLINPVRKVVAEAAERIGLERLDPDIGDRFDPAHHEAVANNADSGEQTELVVNDVVRPGYRIGTRLLRAAEVAVDHPEASSPTAPDDQ